MCQLRASAPIIDSQGLWINLDVTYEGSFCLTLKGKVNLLKLGKSFMNEDDHVPNEEGEDGVDDDFGVNSVNEGLIGNLYDSDAEDSEESDESEVQTFKLKTQGEDGARNNPAPRQPSKRGKIMTIVKKVQYATSNFVSDMNFVKHAFEKVADTPILLTVEVRQASGIITLNLPSPPTNRIWIAFQTKPQLELIISPKLGDQSVNLNPLTDWIHEKLHEQIQAMQ
jgi:hypothetical protein